MINGTSTTQDQSAEVFACRCGGTFLIVEGNGLGVAHTLPACERFDALDVIDFLRWVRLGDWSQERAEA